MIARLFVHYLGRLAGVLTHEPDGTFAFSYDGGWLGGTEAFPLSQQLPLTAGVFRAQAQAFFANLLPEGDTRLLLCRRLGISPGNDFELLAAIGGECAGAFTLSGEEELPPEGKGDYRALPRARLEEYAVTRVLPALDGRGGLRLSLAGAQDKLPVRIDGDKILLPLGSAASTHILKFPNPSYKQLPGNEVLVTLIARTLGLRVVEAQWWPLRREGMCVVARYDRVRSQRGEIFRLHQEDLCQALGLPSSRKYEKENGPGLAQCFEGVRRVSSSPAQDALELLRWTAFNALALNADAHAKNLSLIYSGGAARLAPFYDLVCTRAWDGLAGELAMAVGGEVDPTQLRRKHWQALAAELGIGAKLLVDTVRELAERFPDAVSAGAAEFRARYGEKPALEQVLPKIRRQARRIMKQLA